MGSFYTNDDELEQRFRQSEKTLGIVFQGNPRHSILSNFLIIKINHLIEFINKTNRKKMQNYKRRIEKTINHTDKMDIQGISQIQEEETLATHESFI